MYPFARRGRRMTYAPSLSHSTRPLSYCARIPSVSEVDSIEPSVTVARSLNRNVFMDDGPLHATWILLQKNGRDG